MRIQPVVPGTRSELAEIEQKIMAERGRISPLYQVLLHSPAIAKGWEQMLSAVRNYSGLGAGVRELIILRVAVINKADYEFDAHIPHALKGGVSQAAIDATRELASAHSAHWNDTQQLAIEVTDMLTQQAELSDALYQRVAAQFKEQEQVEVFATVAAYNMVSRFLNAFQIGH
jgi:4-carboxymuconolactone decarboxylase